MTFGNVAVLLALGTVVWGAIFAPAPHTPHPQLSDLTIADFDGFGLMLGIGLIMFSCHLEAVSIEADMARREEFDRVLTLAYVPIIVLVCAFGIGVYIVLGEATGRVWVSGKSGGGGFWEESTIMQNLEDGAFVITVKALMSLNLVLMMPITMLPAFRAIEAAMDSWLTSEASDLQRGGLRLLVVAGLAVGAAVFPGFETIVGLTGALGCLTGFTLPALCYAHFCAPQLSTCQQWFAYFVAAFGLVATAFSFAQQAKEFL